MMVKESRLVYSILVPAKNFFVGSNLSFCEIRDPFGLSSFSPILEGLKMVQDIIVHSRCSV